MNFDFFLYIFLTKPLLSQCTEWKRILYQGKSIYGLEVHTAINCGKKLTHPYIRWPKNENLLIYSHPKLRHTFVFVTLLNTNKRTKKIYEADPYVRTEKRPYDNTFVAELIYIDHILWGRLINGRGYKKYTTMWQRFVWEIEEKNQIIIMNVYTHGIWVVVGVVDQFKTMNIEQFNRIYIKT